MNDLASALFHASLDSMLCSEYPAIREAAERALNTLPATEAHGVREDGAEQHRSATVGGAQALPTETLSLADYVDRHDQIPVSHLNAVRTVASLDSRLDPTAQELEEQIHRFNHQE
jgi:hypothetical protein